MVHMGSIWGYAFDFSCFLGDLVTQASYDTFTSRFNELFDTCLKLFSLFWNRGNTELKSFVTICVIFFESKKNIPFPSWYLSRGQGHKISYVLCGAIFPKLSLSMGKASAGAGGFCHWGLFGPGGLSLFPLALLCLALGAGGYQQNEIGLNEFEGKTEAEDYDDYYDYEMEGVEDEEDWVEYEYVDLQKDSDGDGLR